MEDKLQVWEVAVQVLAGLSCKNLQDTYVSVYTYIQERALLHHTTQRIGG